MGPTDVYGESKLEMERAGNLFHSDTGVPLAVARLFNVFGPGDTNPHLIPTVIEQALRGDILHLGNLNTWRDYVYVDDVTEALALLVHTAPRAQRLVCNLGHETEVHGHAVVQTIGRLLGRKLTVSEDPGRLRVSDRPHLCSDCSRARDLLEWSAVMNLEAGLRMALDEPLALGSAR